MTIKKPARLSQLLSIEFPIIQAPLYHGDSTRLVAEVSNNGGLGMIAGGLLTPEALLHEIQAVRALTDHDFGVNLIVASENEIEDARYEEVIARMQSFAGVGTIDFDSLNTEAWGLSPLSDLIDVLIDESVPVVSFSMGIPKADDIQLLKDSGIKIIGHSTHMLEALLWEEKGVDVHLLQGIESGGMRNTFIGDAEKITFSAQSLIQQALTVLERPFAVSGGIYNKSLFASAIIQGADGVAMGTAFMMTFESGLTDAEFERLHRSNEYDSVMTKHWTGILGRCFSNLGTQALRQMQGETLPFPQQLFLVHAATIDELEEGDMPEEFQPIWASINAPFCHRVAVKTLMDSLVS